MPAAEHLNPAIPTAVVAIVTIYDVFFRDSPLTGIHESNKLISVGVRTPILNISPMGARTPCVPLLRAILSFLTRRAEGCWSSPLRRPPAALAPPKVVVMTAWTVLSDRLRGNASLDTLASRLRADGQRRRALTQRMEVVAAASTQTDPRRIIAAAAKALFALACGENGLGAVVFVTQSSLAEDEPYDAASHAAATLRGDMMAASPPPSPAPAASAGGRGEAAGGGDASQTRRSSDARQQRAAGLGAGGLGLGPATAPFGAGGESGTAAEEEEGEPVIHIECADREARAELQRLFQQAAGAGLGACALDPRAAGGVPSPAAEQPAAAPSRSSLRQARSAASAAAGSDPSTCSGDGSSSEDLLDASLAALTPMEGGGRGLRRSSLEGGSAPLFSLAHLAALSGNLNVVTTEEVALGVNAFADWKAGATGSGVRSAAGSSTAC